MRIICFLDPTKILLTTSTWWQVHVQVGLSSTKVWYRACKLHPDEMALIALRCWLWRQLQNVRAWSLHRQVAQRDSIFVTEFHTAVSWGTVQARPLMRLEYALDVGDVSGRNRCWRLSRGVVSWTVQSLDRHQDSVQHRLVWLSRQSAPMTRGQSCDFTLFRLALDAIQMASVLSAFSYRRREAHHREPS